MVKKLEPLPEILGHPYRLIFADTDVDSFSVVGISKDIFTVRRTIHPLIDDFECKVPHREICSTSRVERRIIPTLEDILGDAFGKEIAESFLTPYSRCVSSVSRVLAGKVFMLEKIIQRHVFAVCTSDIGKLRVILQD